MVKLDEGGVCLRREGQSYWGMSRFHFRAFRVVWNFGGIWVSPCDLKDIARLPLTVLFVCQVGKEVGNWWMVGRGLHTRIQISRRRFWWLKIPIFMATWPRATVLSFYKNIMGRFIFFQFYYNWANGNFLFSQIWVKYVSFKYYWKLKLISVKVSYRMSCNLKQQSHMRCNFEQQSHSIWVE